jgi:oligo-1,6-glucosidase
LGAESESVLAALRVMSRDNARTPMQWDDGPAAGFTSGTPWAPVNPNHTEINATAAVADPDSVFHHYRRLIELRHTEPVVAHGDFSMLLPDDPTVYAFTRRLGTRELLVVANFSGAEALAEVPDAAAWAQAELVLGTWPDPAPTEQLVLRPWEARVYRRG